MNPKLENTHSEKVRRYFDAPDRYLGGDARLAVRRIVCRQMVEGLDRSRILDIGCGDGSMSLPLLDPGGRLTLLDFSAPMLERAKRNIPESVQAGVETVCGDMLHFDPGQRYSLVLCLGVLAHVPDVTESLAKIASLTRPGGHCLLQITDTSKWLGRINYAYHDWRSRERRSHGYALNRLDSERVVAEAEAAGLRPVSRRGYRLTLPGVGRLPGALLLRLERTFLSSRFSRHGGESLLLFRLDES